MNSQTMTAKARRRQLGQFLTPRPVADLMASFFDAAWEEIELLDAGAGSGALTLALVRRLCSLSKRPIVDQELRRDVAIKRMQERCASDLSAHRRFFNEAEIIARLEHSGIVLIYGLVQDENGQPCNAMRFIMGSRPTWRRQTLPTRPVDRK